MKRDRVERVEAGRKAKAPEEARRGIKVERIFVDPPRRDRYGNKISEPGEDDPWLR